MKYKARPVVVEAIQVTEDNTDEVGDFFGHTKGDNKFGWHTKPTPHWAIVISFNGDVGILSAAVGDWVIKKADGTYYPLSSDLFSFTYELVEN